MPKLIKKQCFPVLSNRIRAWEKFNGTAVTELNHLIHGKLFIFTLLFSCNTFLFCMHLWFLLPSRWLAFNLAAPKL